MKIMIPIEYYFNIFRSSKTLWLLKNLTFELVHFKNSLSAFPLNSTSAKIVEISHCYNRHRSCSRVAVAKKKFTAQLQRVQQTKFMFSTFSTPAMLGLNHSTTRWWQLTRVQQIVQYEVCIDRTRNFSSKRFLASSTLQLPMCAIALNVFI